MMPKDANVSEDAYCVIAMWYNIYYSKSAKSDFVRSQNIFIKINIIISFDIVFDFVMLQIRYCDITKLNI